VNGTSFRGCISWLVAGVVGVEGTSFVVRIAWPADGIVAVEGTVAVAGTFSIELMFKIGAITYKKNWIGLILWRRQFKESFFLPDLSLVILGPAGILSLPFLLYFVENELDDGFRVGRWEILWKRKREKLDFHENCINSFRSWGMLSIRRYSNSLPFRGRFGAISDLTIA
jgi:hypothetical protein